MSRFSLLSGTVALLAISRVNAGPCRPSSSVVSSGLETATSSTGAVEPTTTLATTLTVETEVSETVSIIVSTAEASTTSQDTTTEGVVTTEDTTTTEAATTTAETTTALATTSAAPVLEPRRDCGSVSSPYTAPNGVTYNILCNTDFEPAFFNPGEFPEDIASFEECLLKCATSSVCHGVQWDNLNSYCVTMRSYQGTYQTIGNDIAIRVGG